MLCWLFSHLCMLTLLLHLVCQLIVSPLCARSFSHQPPYISPPFWSPHPSHHLTAFPFPFAFKGRDTPPAVPGPILLKPFAILLKPFAIQCNTPQVRL